MTLPSVGSGSLDPNVPRDASQKDTKCTGPERLAYQRFQFCRLYQYAVVQLACPVRPVLQPAAAVSCGAYNYSL
jgi:hypothetical protein